MATSTRNAQEILERGKISRARAVHAPCREGGIAQKSAIGPLASRPNRAFMLPTNAIIRGAVVIGELHQARILDAPTLARHEGIDDVFGDLPCAVAQEVHDQLAVAPLRPFDSWADGVFAWVVHVHGAVRAPRPSPKSQGRDVTLADPAERDEDAQTARLDVRLVGVGHDAGVEQGDGFEGELLAEIGADELALIRRGGRTIRHQAAELLVATSQQSIDIAMPILQAGGQDLQLVPHPASSSAKIRSMTLRVRGQSLVSGSSTMNGRRTVRAASGRKDPGRRVTISAIDQPPTQAITASITRPVSSGSRTLIQVAPVLRAGSSLPPGKRASPTKIISLMGTPSTSFSLLMP